MDSSKAMALSIVSCGVEHAYLRTSLPNLSANQPSKSQRYCCHICGGVVVEPREDAA